MVKDKLFRANGSGSSLELVPERQLTVCSNALFCLLLPLLYSFAGNANMLSFCLFLFLFFFVLFFFVMVVVKKPCHMHSGIYESETCGLSYYCFYQLVD